MKGKDFERFAIGLAKNCKSKNFRKIVRTSDAVCYRTAISRLYYGILHEIKEWLAKNGNPLREREIGRIHLIVRNRLKAMGSKEIKEAAEYLKLLHELRKEADYDLESPIGYAEWRTAFYYAKMIKRRIGL